MSPVDATKIDFQNTMADPIEIAIYGAGGFAREGAWLAEDCASRGAPITVRCFIGDAEITPGELVNGIPVLSLADAPTRQPRGLVVAGVGHCNPRKAGTQRGAGR